MTVIFTAVSGILPALFWLWFWLKEDRKKPEPTWMIVHVFLLGSLMVLPAYFIEKALIGSQPVVATSLTVTVIISWAAIEEILKYLAAYLGAFRRRCFDEPVDAMVYLITAALGFAAIENTLFIFNILKQSGTSDLVFLITGNFRFIGATVIHVVTSALLGSLVGITFYQTRTKKILASGLGLVVAIALHALFNYSIIYQGENRVMITFIGLWLAAILIIFLFERVKATIIRIKTQNLPR